MHDDKQARDSVNISDHTPSGWGGDYDRACMYVVIVHVVVAGGGMVVLVAAMGLHWWHW